MATVRITNDIHSVLKELAKLSNESLQAVLAKAIEQYRRQQFLEQFNEDYARLRGDQKAWKEEQKERALLETSLMDDLKDDE